MNRPSCYGTTAKQSPEFRNHKCINCLYLLDCVEKETMMEKQTRPDCYGTQPKPDTVLWDERKCKECINLESCCRVTFGVTTTKSYPEQAVEEMVILANQKQPFAGYPDTKKVLGGTTIDGVSIESVVAEMNRVGTKLDQNKPRWSLLPSGTIIQVIRVLEYGAEKYAVDNWQHVPDARTRYYDAAMRHLDAWHRGEMNDDESGLPHLAHAACCLLFLLWFDGKSVS
jgi:hypothetical protein